VKSKIYQCYTPLAICFWTYFLLQASAAGISNGCYIPEFCKNDSSQLWHPSKTKFN